MQYVIQNTSETFHVQSLNMVNGLETLSFAFLKHNKHQYMNFVVKLTNDSHSFALLWPLDYDFIRKTGGTVDGRIPAPPNM